MQLWNIKLDQFKRTAVQELSSVSIGSTVAVCACVLIYSLTKERKTQRHRWGFTALFLICFFALVAGLVSAEARSIVNR